VFSLFEQKIRKPPLMSHNSSNSSLIVLQAHLRKKNFAPIHSRIHYVIKHLEGLSNINIAKLFSVSRNTVSSWILRFKSGGVQALFDRPRTGRPPLLKPDQLHDFEKRIEQGPLPGKDKTSIFVGKDMLNILNESFSVSASLRYVYNLLNKLRFSLLVARPRHEKQDPVKVENWLKELPQAIAEVKKKHPEKNIVFGFEDESRYGQKSYFTKIWAKKGTKPIRVKQDGFLCSYLYGIVEPKTGQSFGYVYDHTSKEFMKIFLSEYSKQLNDNDHVFLILDGAKWHQLKPEECPSNITLHKLPPYSPELNPVERVWKFIKQKKLSFQRYQTKEEIIEAGVEGWNYFSKSGIVKTLCACSYL
jgi:transposase